MSTKLRVSGQSGVEIYAIIRNSDGKIWDGTAFATFNIANKDDYDISLTEQGSTGYYSVAFPTAIAAGSYHITYHQRLVSGAVDLTTPDDIWHQETKEWNGSAIVSSLENEASITDICNMALAHLAQTDEIDNFETDTTEAAILCRRFFATARDKTLRDYTWNFATQYLTAGLVESDPTTEWLYSYRYPSDCLMLRRILSGTRPDDGDSDIPYEVARDESGRVIYTDMEDAVIEYTIRETNPSFYTPDFTLALSALLAFYIAPKLTRGDKNKLGARAFDLYRLEIKRAWTNNLNEPVKHPEPDTKSIRARI